MITEKDRKIICELRENGRQKLQVLAKRVGIPLSTTHERLKKLVRNEVIRPITLPMFSKMQFPLQCWFVVSTKKRKECISYFEQLPHANTVLHVHGGATLLCECIFSSFQEQYFVQDNLAKFGKITCYNVVSQVKKEAMQLASVH